MVRVEADSLYEAVAKAVAEFRQDSLTPNPTSLTEFTVTIERPPTKHRIRLAQGARRAEGTQGGPAAPGGCELSRAARSDC